MTTLSDHTDRLTYVAKSIKSTTARTGVLGNANHPGAEVAGPFTAAVLYTHLGDLIRDVDPSELGLFNLVHPPDPGANHARDRDNGNAPIPEITRVEFPGATPLKKLARKEEMQKRKELEPELYAQAALKYMDRYESIRPMPRAHAQVESIIEQLATVRENMRVLSNSLEQARIADTPQSPKDMANQEERRIQHIQTKILDLKNRKEAALKRGKGGLKKMPRSKPTSSRQNLNGNPHPPATSLSKTDTHEETFWTTPAPAARTLRFDSLLNDDLVDLGDVSTSFASPMPPPRSTQNRLTPPTSDITEGADIPQSLPDASLFEPDDTFRDLKPEGRVVVDEVDEDKEELDEGEDEKTIVLKKVSLSPPPPEPSSPPSAIVGVESPSPAQQSNAAQTPSGRGQSQKHRVRVTNEVERIVTKIWATVGEVIMPGHPFDVSGSASAGTKPPRAKETLVHLHTLSAQTPSPTSPTSSSLSSHSTLPHNQAHPTPQQILTAYLIILLLSSQPHFSVPLHKMKEALADKAQGSLGVGRGTTSVLYGCVAKRLVRIDRGGGEQVVKFDVM